MKKNIFVVLPLLIFILIFSSCFNHHNLSVYISDDKNDYEMDASFQKRQTHAVQKYLNANLLAFENEWHKYDLINKEVTLNDNTTFFIDAAPGALRIKIDKEENSEQAYEKIRQVCEEIKDLLADNN
ncbi:MAG TPA: hypothetical protein PK987_01095 [Ferruginibacter sp.]|nr:hypothetical protein [Ferruginibacter sp.]